MLEDSLALKPIAMWNSVRGVWETTQVSLLCGHLEPFLETWPASGMMRGGRVYGLPMLAHLTTGSESLLLRTPVADEAGGGPLSPEMAKVKGQTLLLTGQIIDLVEPDRLPKPLLPTPNTMDHLPARSPEKIAESKERTPGGYANVREVVVNDLLPTPVASEGTKAPAQQSAETKSKTGQVWLSNHAKDMEVSWGKFEPAIRRWEVVTGREAPAPTKPDGKDGQHRLSAQFTEWMMGLPSGWITSEDIGLTRNEALKACGNGVVPQQAVLALRMLLDGVNIERERERET